MKNLIVLKIIEPQMPAGHISETAFTPTGKALRYDSGTQLKYPEVDRPLRRYIRSITSNTGYDVPLLLCITYLK